MWKQCPRSRILLNGTGWEQYPRQRAHFFPKPGRPRLVTNKDRESYCKVWPPKREAIRRRIHNCMATFRFCKNKRTETRLREFFWQFPLYKQRKWPISPLNLGFVLWFLHNLKMAYFTVWTEKTRLIRWLSSLSFKQRRNRLVLDSKYI